MLSCPRFQKASFSDESVVSRQHLGQMDVRVEAEYFRVISGEGHQSSVDRLLCFIRGFLGEKRQTDGQIFDFNGQSTTEVISEGKERQEVVVTSLLLC